MFWCLCGGCRLWNEPLHMPPVIRNWRNHCDQVNVNVLWLLVLFCDFHPHVKFLHTSHNLLNQRMTRKALALPTGGPGESWTLSKWQWLVLGPLDQVPWAVLDFGWGGGSGASCGPLEPQSRHESLVSPCLAASVTLNFILFLPKSSSGRILIIHDTDNNIHDTDIHISSYYSASKQREGIPLGPQDHECRNHLLWEFSTLSKNTTVKRVPFRPPRMVKGSVLDRPFTSLSSSILLYIILFLIF